MMPFFDLSVIFLTLNLYDYFSQSSETLFGPHYNSKLGIVMWGVVITMQVINVYNKLA